MEQLIYNNIQLMKEYAEYGYHYYDEIDIIPLGFTWKGKRVDAVCNYFEMRVSTRMPPP